MGQFIKGAWVDENVACGHICQCNKCEHPQSDTNGYFENGRWIPTVDVWDVDLKPIKVLSDERIIAAREDLNKAIDDHIWAFNNQPIKLSWYSRMINWITDHIFKL